MHTILQKRSQADLSLWSSTNHVQVHALVQALLEGLKLWPYTTEIMTKFCAIRKVRDKTLHQAPNFLNDLLENVTTSAQGFDRGSSLCVSILALPLPASIPLPSSAQPFLHQLFEKAVASPNAQNVEPVYRLLYGACESLLELLPAASLNRFREHLVRMMRTVANEPLLTLLCLAILAKIYLKCIDASDIEDQKQTTQSSSDFLSESLSPADKEKITKFFTGERSHQILEVLTLQVIDACNQNYGHAAEPARRMRLSREVAEAIDHQTRKQWVEKGQRSFRKLSGKLALDLQPDRRTEVSGS